MIQYLVQEEYNFGIAPPSITYDLINPQFLSSKIVLIQDYNSTNKQSKKVLCTLATGQSDITRHEAYTKAQGLNEFNSLNPQYFDNTPAEEKILQTIRKTIPDATEIVLVYTGEESSSNVNAAYIGVLVYGIPKIIGSNDTYISMGCTVGAMSDFIDGWYHYDSTINSRLNIQEDSDVYTDYVYSIPSTDFNTIWKFSAGLVNTEPYLYIHTRK